MAGWNLRGYVITVSDENLLKAVVLGRRTVDCDAWLRKLASGSLGLG